MQIFDISFLFCIFPLFLLVYWIAGKRYRYLVLCLFNLLFYWSNEPRGIVATLSILLLNYVISQGVTLTKNHEKQKKLFTVGIIADAMMLMIPKVSAFAGTGSIPLLMGQSFFTFTMISYLVDVYNEKVLPERNVIRYVNSIIMFPKIMMGPITRTRDLNESSFKMTMGNFYEGARRVIVGFCKKAIIADNLSLLVSDVNTMWYSSSIASLWIGSIAFSLQLYFDFSGYTDIAVGIAKMCGIKLCENFNYPYFCSNIRDFWKRWHISLSIWFRDYVYIPLGGSKTGMVRTVVNLFVVWILTGIWHGNGLQFILWGILYFVMLIFERYIIVPERLWGGISWIYRVLTLMAINFNWVIFSHDNVKAGIAYCLHMLGYHMNFVINVNDVRLLREYGIYLIIACIVCVPIIPKLKKNIVTHHALCYNIVSSATLILLFIWGLSFIIVGGHNPFLYRNF